MHRIDRHLLTVLAGLSSVLIWAGPAGAGVVQRSTGLWPDGEVRYSFGPGVTAGDRAAVRLAMQSWTEAGAPVRFVAATSGPRLSILRHRSEDGANRCRATVGRGAIDRAAPRGAFEQPAGTGAPPTARSFLILSGPCRHRVMVHEIGHVLGLDHEHERNDRSAWLTVRRLPPPAGTSPLALAERDALWRRSAACPRRRERAPSPWPSVTPCGDGTILSVSLSPPRRAEPRQAASARPPG